MKSVKARLVCLWKLSCSGTGFQQGVSKYNIGEGNFRILDETNKIKEYKKREGT